MRQKDVFLRSEGDAWFARNAELLASTRQAESDRLLQELRWVLDGSVGASVLEIGCSDGRRLASLRAACGCRVYGVDPSAAAVQAARARGVNAFRGTADVLPFAARAFDVVVFGFCLYLCDRDDLFRIAAEADRVLKNPGWLLIHDFFSETPTRRPYHHVNGLFSHKMDYVRLWTWHPAYTLASHRITSHRGALFTDDPGEQVATSVLRKHAPEESR